eukprot:137342_1
MSSDVSSEMKSAVRSSEETVRPADRVKRPSDRSTRPSNRAPRPSNHVTRPAKDAVRSSSNVPRSSNRSIQSSNDAKRPSDQGVRSSKSVKQQSDRLEHTSEETTLPPNGDFAKQVPQTPPSQTGKRRRKRVRTRYRNRSSGGIQQPSASGQRADQAVPASGQRADQHNYVCSSPSRSSSGMSDAIIDEFDLDDLIDGLLPAKLIRRTKDGKWLAQCSSRQISIFPGTFRHPALSPGVEVLIEPTKLQIRGILRGAAIANGESSASRPGQPIAHTRSSAATRPPTRPYVDRGRKRSLSPSSSNLQSRRIQLDNSERIIRSVSLQSSSRSAQKQKQPAGKRQATIGSSWADVAQGMHPASSLESVRSGIGSGIGSAQLSPSNGTALPSRSMSETDAVVPVDYGATTATTMASPRSCIEFAVPPMLSSQSPSPTSLMNVVGLRETASPAMYQYPFGMSPNDAEFAAAMQSTSAAPIGNGIGNGIGIGTLSLGSGIGSGTMSLGNGSGTVPLGEASMMSGGETVLMQPQPASVAMSTQFRGTLPMFVPGSTPSLSPSAPPFLPEGIGGAVGMKYAVDDGRRYYAEQSSALANGSYPSGTVDMSQSTQFDMFHEYSPVSELREDLANAKISDVLPGLTSRKSPSQIASPTSIQPSRILQPSQIGIHSQTPQLTAQSNLQSSSLTAQPQHSLPPQLTVQSSQTPMPSHSTLTAVRSVPEINLGFQVGGGGGGLFTSATGGAGGGTSDAHGGAKASQAGGGGRRHSEFAAPGGPVKAKSMLSPLSSTPVSQSDSGLRSTSFSGSTCSFPENPELQPHELSLFESLLGRDDEMEGQQPVQKLWTHVLQSGEVQ